MLHKSWKVWTVVVALMLDGAAASAGPGDDMSRNWSDYNSLKRDYEDLSSKVDRYIERSRKLKAMDKEELDKLITQICRLDIEKRDDDADRLAKGLVDKVQDNVKREYASVESEASELATKVMQLGSKLKSVRSNTEPYSRIDEVKSDAGKLISELEGMMQNSGRLFDKVDADMKSLYNIKEGVINGTNNPKIRAAIEYGKEKHEYNQRICAEKEVTLSSGRPDCISFNKDQCTVWEFKPDSIGESAAKAQAEGYLADVQRYFKDDPRAKENCKKDASGLPIFEAKGVTYPACRP